MTEEPIDPSRRRCLQSIGGVLTLTALGSGFSVTGCKRDGPPAATTTSNPATEGPFDVNFRLTSKRELVRIKAPESALDVATDTSHTTEVWRYVGAPFSGSADALLSMERGDVDPAGLLRPSQGMGELTETAHPSNEGVERGYLGPLIILRRGQRVRAELQNNLDEETNVHWHGLHIPPETDGQPRNPVKPGKSRAVAFDVTDRAGLYWYHPLPHGRRGGRAGFQTYMGMAGPLVIRDETEDALDLPAGEQELLMVLQDRRFDGERLEYMPHGTRETLTRLRGVHGDELLVNGCPTGNARSVRERTACGCSMPPTRASTSWPSVMTGR
jgi:FtsP/CotA-like multicopper oxidase with cupredoxin domain